MARVGAIRAMIGRSDVDRAAMPRLYYVHDPMCSWCYAFAPTWQRIAAALPAGLDVELLVGGLAPDSDVPMPAEMRAYIESTWHRIQRVVPGTIFNFEYWQRATPRRSTYPACRAVLAAKHFDPALEWPMIAAIQRAYYREARNPSDLDTLAALATELGLDHTAFTSWCKGDACRAQLERDLEKTRALGVMGFPSLVLETASGTQPIPHAFGDPRLTLDVIDGLVEATMTVT